MKHPSLLLCSCSPPARGDQSDAEYKRRASSPSMHDSIAADLADLVRRGARAPGRRADATRGRDADAARDRSHAWRKARVAYEHVEGATAPIFPDLDVSMDARYDDFLAERRRRRRTCSTARRDRHARDRAHPVRAADSRRGHRRSRRTLPGYRPAALPDDRRARRWRSRRSSRRSSSTTPTCSTISGSRPRSTSAPRTRASSA